MCTAKTPLPAKIQIESDKLINQREPLENILICKRVEYQINNTIWYVHNALKSLYMCQVVPNGMFIMQNSY